MGEDVAYPVGVCNFDAFGDLRLVDEKYGSGARNALAFRAGFSFSVGMKSTPFDGIGAGPNFRFWTFKESVKGGLFYLCFLERCGEGGNVMGIPFHADVLGNVVYRSSITSVVAMENTLYLSGHIGLVGRFSDC